MCCQVYDRRCRSDSNDVLCLVISLDRFGFNKLLLLNGYLPSCPYCLRCLLYNLISNGELSYIFIKGGGIDAGFVCM
jgi:hypothetical protein